MYIIESVEVVQTLVREALTVCAFSLLKLFHTRTTNIDYLWDFFYGKKSDNKYRTRIKTLDNGSLDNYLLDPSKKPLKLFVPNIDAEDRVLVQLVQSLRLGERPDRPLQPIETFKAVLEDASNKTAPEVVVARLYNSKFFTKDEESKLGKVLADLSCSGYLTSQHPAGKDGLVCPWLKGIILPSSTLMTEYANFPIITVSEYCKVRIASTAFPPSLQIPGSC